MTKYPKEIIRKDDGEIYILIEENKYRNKKMMKQFPDSLPRFFKLDDFDPKYFEFVYEN